MGRRDVIKVPVSVSIDKAIDDWIDSFSKRPIDVQGEKLNTNKSKSLIYSDAIVYAMEHTEDWLFKSKEKFLRLK